MKTYVLSQHEALKYEPKTDNEIAISITCAEDPPASLSPKFRAILRLTFDDVDHEHMHWKEKFDFFTLEQAHEILDFIDKHEPDALLCHCYAGISRSAATMIALMDYLGNEREAEFWEKVKPMYNRHVRSTIERAIDQRVAAGGA